MREINGFIVDATTVQPDPNVAFFHAALRVYKPGTDFDEINDATPQNFEEMSRERALRVAQEWEAQIESVTYNGQLNWNE